MLAALCRTLDGPTAISIDTIAEPVAAPGEALVEVAAVGLNFADTLMTRGRYQFKPELPFSPGAEIAGRVVAFGDGAADGLAIGQRVMAYTGWNGARQRVAVPVSALVPIPDGVPDDIAAGLTVTYGTAIHGLNDRGAVRAGETVVVTGASGGAGQAAVEIAVQMGARVIAVASSEDRLAIAAALGASDGIIFPGGDLKTQVRDLTNGRGADVIYDCIGGEAAEPLVRALAWQGRFLVVGFAAGQIPKLPLNLLLLKGASAVGVFWGEAIRRDPSGHRANMANVLQWVESGRLKPRIHGHFPLDRIADAIGVLDRREASGKVILTI